MNLEEKYEEFLEEYFKNAALLSSTLFKNFPKISAILMSPKAPLPKEDWLKKELKEAIESEDYTYCIKLKKELDGLQKDIRADRGPEQTSTT